MKNIRFWERVWSKVIQWAPTAEHQAQVSLLKVHYSSLYTNLAYYICADTIYYTIVWLIYRCVNSRVSCFWHFRVYVSWTWHILTLCFVTCLIILQQHPTSCGGHITLKGLLLWARIFWVKWKSKKASIKDTSCAECFVEDKMSSGA